MNSKDCRTICFRTIVGLVLNLLVVVMAQAQGAKGTIRGHVIDASGDVLQGAQITLQRSDVSLASDVRGDFFVRDLEPGSYTFTISYVGFAPASKTVDLVAGQVVSVDVKLEVLSQNEQVLVTAERAAGEAEAINRERSADNIVQVLTADVIRSCPTRIWPMHLAVCPASAWSGTKEKANMCRFAEPNLVSPIPPWTE